MQRNKTPIYKSTLKKNSLNDHQDEINQATSSDEDPYSYAKIVQANSSEEEPCTYANIVEERKRLVLQGNYINYLYEDFSDYTSDEDKQSKENKAITAEPKPITAEPRKKSGALESKQQRIMNKPFFSIENQHPQKKKHVPTNTYTAKKEKIYDEGALARTNHPKEIVEEPPAPVYIATSASSPPKLVMTSVPPEFDHVVSLHTLFGDTTKKKKEKKREKASSITSTIKEKFFPKKK